MRTLVVAALVSLVGAPIPVLAQDAVRYSPYPVSDDSRMRDIKRDLDGRAAVSGNADRRQAAPSGSDWATGPLTVLRPGVSASNVKLAIGRISARAEAQGRGLTAVETRRIETLRRLLDDSGEAKRG